MIIQHNIMAMNAYRNYMGNTNALAKNLEKLSSGYRINRAGDDAAGLAISEKMRAQITGLDAAQKNVQDGISLVQTAEGALQEVQDMLNRMVYLATQSANGTYDSEVDRANLQKEVDALCTEIDRIADSANFNGIKLLDGSLSEVKGGIRTRVEAAGMDRIISDIKTAGEKAYEVVGEKTVFDSYAGTATAASFTVDLSGLKFEVNSAVCANAAKNSAAASGVFEDVVVQVGDLTIELNKTYASAVGLKWSVTATGAGTCAGVTHQAIGSALVKSLAMSAGASFAIVELNGVDWKVTSASTGLKFVQVAKPTSIEEARANFDVSFSSKDDSISVGGAHPGGTVVNTPGVYVGQNDAANTVFEITADDIVDGAKIKLGQGSTAVTVTIALGAKSNVDISAATTATEKIVDLTSMDPDNVDLNYALTKIAEAFGKATVQFTGEDSKGKSTTATFIVGVSDGADGHPTGLAVQRATAPSSAGQVVFNELKELAENFSLKYTKVSVANEGLTLQIGDTSDNYNQLQVSVEDMHVAALGIGGIDISSQKGAQEAVDKIKAAINSVSSTRGTLGATQNRLEHTANNLAVMEENIQDAESAIRDTDIAEEMMAYTKNNILIQSAQAMLAQANMVPQGVLQLLQ